MKTIETFLTITLLVFFFTGFIGCGVAQVALEQHRERSPGTVDVAKTPSYNPDQVAKYNKIVVTSRESGANQLGVPIYAGATATGGASASILSGRVALELAKVGYDVIEQADLEQAMSGQKMETDKEQSFGINFWTGEVINETSVTNIITIAATFNVYVF